MLTMRTPYHPADEASGPVDQADGLRRLFASGRRQRLVPVAFNAHVDCTPILLERLAGAFSELGATCWSPTARRAPTPWPRST
jgi:hypothetical protein